MPLESDKSRKVTSSLPFSTPQNISELEGSKTKVRRGRTRKQDVTIIDGNKGKRGGK